MLKYYRADTRDNLRIASPKELYPFSDSGGRPKTCKKEIAFSDSIGGAVYGASQNLFSEDIRELNPEDFLDFNKIFKIHVYETTEEPTYTVEPSGTSFVMNTSSDYEVTGEVRYCDRNIPIKKVCSCNITKHDQAVIRTMLYHGTNKEYFDWSKGMSKHCNQEEKEFGYWQSDDCSKEHDKLIDRVIGGDIAIIKKLLLKKPIPVPENVEGEYAEGILTDIAFPLAKILGKRCK